MAATTPPKKPARTRPATKPPATAAAEEARGDNVEFEFRGEQFAVPRDRISSMHLQLALAEASAGNIIFETLGPIDARRFLTRVERGESADVVSAEFMKAFGEALGVGNS